jgi:flagellar M-ring protein FliF
MASSQRTEDSSGSGGANGVPGTASTLPKPTSRPGTNPSHASRVTENITYQSTRTVKKTKMPAGLVRKMSLAVLVDQAVRWEPDKSGPRRVLVPPPPEELKIIHDMVAGVTGFNAERGDQLVIETLPFESTLLLEPPLPPGAPGLAKPSAPPGPTLKLDQKTLLIAGGAVLGLIVLGMLVGMLSRRRTGGGTAEVTGPAALTAGEGAMAATGGSRGPGLEQQIESKLAEHDALQQKMDAQALNSLKLSPVITKKAEVFAKHLREKIKTEPEVSAQILHTWIREEEN